MSESEPLPFHRLARTPGYRWWRPLIELLLVGLIGLPLALISILLVSQLVDDPREGVGGLLVLAASIVPFLPASRLAARAVGRSPGALSSVQLRLRWGWLLRCALVAIAVMIAVLVVYAIARALGAPFVVAELPGWPGLEAFWAPFLAILLVIPLQAAAEEYVFRGTLVQAIGAWVASPWAAIAVSTIVFALAHGLGLTGFVALAGFGLIAAWLTIRTGGIEAAIGLHVINNVVLFTSIAAGGGSDTWIRELNTDITWAATFADLAGLGAYAAIIIRLKNRRAIGATANVVRSPSRRHRSQPLHRSRAMS